jgi:hypothetical protein
LYFTDLFYWNIQQAQYAMKDHAFSITVVQRLAAAKPSDLA